MTRGLKRNISSVVKFFVRNYHSGFKWLSGVIQQKTGPVSYHVQLTNGKERRCHQDQIRKRLIGSPSEFSQSSEIMDISASS